MCKMLSVHSNLCLLTITFISTNDETSQSALLSGQWVRLIVVVRRVEIIEIECLSWAMVISEGMIELQCNHQPSHC